MSKHRSRVLVSVLKNKRNIFIFSLLFISGVLLILGVFKFLEPPHKPSSPSIRSDLVIPVETSLLNRPELLKKIEEKLKGEESIQTVALVGIVGMGGVGKTTLARYFGRLYSASVVWEINAETHTSLINSFKDLATKLSTTKELSEELNTIQNIQDAEEKEKKLLAFVKSRLKEAPSWLLIYDNVEDFSGLGCYFPQDVTVWGETGKVILTTRNANIKEHHSIKPENIIPLDELTTEEALTLFSKIRYGRDSKQLSGDQKEETLKFLKNIPPFPLDVSVAAYYIKSNNLTYRQYLERIAGFNQNFEKSQEALLKESSDYTKTRYGIITSSLAKMIETNQEYQELLLFISLLDSQNIPRDLLESYKNPTLVDSFIHELKKYSLITAESLPSSTQPQAFSIHRSTQEIILDYLTKSLELEKKPELIEKISVSFGSYIDALIQREDFANIKSLVTHCEAFFGYVKVVPLKERLLIKSYLGVILFYLRDYMKAKKALGEELEYYSTLDLRDLSPLYQILIYLSYINMELGDNSKAREYLERIPMSPKCYSLKDQVWRARCLALMGDIYIQIGDYYKAESVIRQSLRIYEKCENDQVGFARSLGSIGSFHLYIGEYEKAKSYFDQSLTLYRKHLPTTPISYAWVFVFLGKAYKGVGQDEKAKGLFEEAVKVYRENLHETHPDTIWASLYLIDVWVNLKKYKPAEEMAKKSVDVCVQLFGKNNIRTAAALIRLGNVNKGLKDYRKAEEALKQALKSYNESFGETHVQTARVSRDLALVYLEKGQLETAEGLLLKALAIFQQNKHPDSYTCLESLAELYLQKAAQSKEPQQFKAQALDYLKQALTIVKERLPVNSPHLARIQTKAKANPV